MCTSSLTNKFNMDASMHISRVAILTALFLSAPATTLAVPFEYIRIGGIDGFGYGDAAGYSGADGQAAHRGDGGVLGTGDLLPDLDGSRILAAGKTEEDNFDNRSSETISCGGSCTINPGSTGELFTDISLSMTYDRSRSANKVYNHNTGTHGAGGAFPTPPSANAPNQPGFNFDFSVSTADIDASAKMFFNLIFADYDVIPAGVEFTRRDGTKFTQAVTTQPGDLDGLIQAAFVELAFTDIFTLNGDKFEGSLKVDFNAENEPYTAFDFVELSTSQIIIESPDDEPGQPEPPPPPVPVPSPALLMLFGLAWLGFRRP